MFIPPLLAERSAAAEGCAWRGGGLDGNRLSLFRLYPRAGKRIAFMNKLEETLASLAPGIRSCRLLDGEYISRQGLAIYFLPSAGVSLTQPGTVLGEAMASRSGLGCTMLEGVPDKIPSGAVVIGLYDDLKKVRPDLLQQVSPPVLPGEYTIVIEKNALITAQAQSGLVSGIQTLAMLILRHQEDRIHAAVIHDRPAKSRRGLVVEMKQHEVQPALLFQIMSFASTFKANHLEFALPFDFDPGAAPKLDAATQACRSNGMEIVVSQPFLVPLLLGQKQPAEVWSALKSAALTFDAGCVAFSDPCPDGIDQATARRLVEAIAENAGGAGRVAVDLSLIRRAGLGPETLDSPYLAVRHTVGTNELPEPAYRDKKLALVVESHLCGLSSIDVDSFHQRLDRASDWLGDGKDNGLLISFGNVGFSHIWQNCLPGAAAGLILGWGVPAVAEEATANFAELLYGDGGEDVMEVWRALGNIFPRGLSAAQEHRLGEIAFGAWPEKESDIELLTGINWQSVVEQINYIAGQLERIPSGLTRNRSTLSGPYLTLQSLAWLCRLSYLLPEMSLRLSKGQDDQQTAHLADELMKSFIEWRTYLVNLQNESGLSVIDMPRLDLMGNRLDYMCGERQE